MQVFYALFGYLYHLGDLALLVGARVFVWVCITLVIGTVCTGVGILTNLDNTLMRIQFCNFFTSIFMRKV